MKQHKEQTTVWISNGLHQKIKKHCDKEGMKICKWVEKICDKELNNEQKTVK